ncbi:MAG: aldo/keto reductase [Mycobacteriaceae bacterium]
MKPTDTASVRGLSLPRLGLGTAPLGGLFTSVPDSEAHATVEAAWDLGLRFFDTAPLYGYGSAERRLGTALADMPRDDFTLATKVGRLLRHVSKGDGSDVDRTQTHEGQPFYKDTSEAVPVFDFSYDGALRSLEESLERLGVDRVDVVHVHDPDNHLEEAINGACRALVELRDQGVIGAVGVGIDYCAPAVRLVDEVDLDCLLIAGRWTLLDHEALTALLPRALERQVAIIAAGVFNSGVLAAPTDGATFDYVPCSADVVARAQQMDNVCARHGVPLKAAALQFPYRHPAVAAVVTGARSPAEITENVELADLELPAALWEELSAECGVPELSPERP